MTIKKTNTGWRCMVVIYLSLFVVFFFYLFIFFLFSFWLYLCKTKLCYTQNPISWKGQALDKASV